MERDEVLAGWLAGWLISNKDRNDTYRALEGMSTARTIRYNSIKPTTNAEVYNLQLLLQKGEQRGGGLCVEKIL